MKESELKKRYQSNLFLAIYGGIIVGWYIGDYQARQKAKEAALLSRLYDLERHARESKGEHTQEPVPVKVVE